MTEPLLSVCTYGEPLLRRPTSAVQRFDDRLATLLRRMHVRMDAAGGKGIAANQVGVSLRAFAWRAGPDDVGSCINPTVLAASQETVRSDEGCLSFPRGFRFLVERPNSIEVSFQDLDGQHHSRKIDGQLARTFLHEIDHLNGALFIDRLSTLDRARAQQLIAAGELQVIPQPFAQTQ